MERRPPCYRVYFTRNDGVEVFVRVRNLEEAAVYKAFVKKEWPDATGLEVLKEVSVELTEAEAQELRDRG